MLQGKSQRTVTANVLDVLAAGHPADIAQLASDFQMGPANSVSGRDPIWAPLHISTMTQRKPFC